MSSRMVVEVYSSTHFTIHFMGGCSMESRMDSRIAEQSLASAETVRNVETMESRSKCECHTIIKWTVEVEWRA